MARATRAQAEANRAAMVDAAGWLMRAEGTEAVTVESVSARAGMTRGSFYKQFASREALLVEALAASAEQRRSVMQSAAERDPGRTLASFAEVYLSPAHRDDAGEGCVVAALAGQVAYDEHGPLRDGFDDAVQQLVDAVAKVSESHSPQRALADVALLVGALQLARASAGTARSEEFLEAAKQALLD